MLQCIKITNKEDTRNPLTFTRGKLELVLTENATWEFAQDMTGTSNTLEQKTFTFGERYGILKHKDSERSYVNISGKAWYLSTIEETAMPVLRDTNPSVSSNCTNFIELKEVSKYKYSISWNE